MSRPSFGHHRLFCIVPPIVLRSIAQNGTPQQRAAALRTLSTDQTIRALRMAQPPQPARAAARRPRLEVMDVRPRRTIFDAHGTQSLPGEVVRVEGGPPSRVATR